MIKKKLSRKQMVGKPQTQIEASTRHQVATKIVYDKFQKNPDTSVYSKKFTHKQSLEE